ncbi:MAG: hypothetical protein BMS9Abin13_401 [Patescibacteria group bacterium]|nr:MAG: hypothetical protein BMS9Abin13_401 [Patescibacteria group bacterium]
MLWDCSFPDRFAQLDEAHTNAEILRWYRKQYFFEWSKKRMLRKILREFNEHGGIIKAKHVSVEDIAGALAKDCPPILFVKTDALDKNVHAETKYDRHCIIPIATYRKTIRVADPNLRGTTVYSLKQIFDACHGTYPTSALFITPREE